MEHNLDYFQNIPTAWSVDNGTTYEKPQTAESLSPAVDEELLTQYLTQTQASQSIDSEESIFSDLDIVDDESIMNLLDDIRNDYASDHSFNELDWFEDDNQEIPQLDGADDDSETSYFTKTITGMYSPQIESSSDFEKPRCTSPTCSNGFQKVTFDCQPPSQIGLVQSSDIPKVENRKPYFSKLEDVPESSKTINGRDFKRPKRSNAFHEIDDAVGFSNFWTLSDHPPSISNSQKFLDDRLSKLSSVDKNMVSQVDFVSTVDERNAFKFTPIIERKKLDTDASDHLTILSLELHVQTRNDKFPDPNLDPIDAVFLSIKSRKHNDNNNTTYLQNVLIIINTNAKSIDGFSRIIHVNDEEHLISALVCFVKEEDPDILLGFEILNSSWGYLNERASKIYSLNLLDTISRLPDLKGTKTKEHEQIKISSSREIQAALVCTGRILLNVWQILKGEVALTSYSIENVVFHVLHQRIPKFSYMQLTLWYRDKIHLHKTLGYYNKRVLYNIRLLEDTNFIKKTCEEARLIGIDFASAVKRGSQYKVESIMARITKPENYIMISPTRKQVSEMRAPESIPLVMEPISRFYESPMLVLDFQSLYPSIIIAYNYWYFIRIILSYSTCLGKISDLNSDAKLGILDEFNSNLTNLVEKDVKISPNGLVFLKEDKREGVMRRMLSEILETRLMVKKSMPLYKDNRALSKILDSRQLALKLIANVTYGYAGASFSGRMPFAELADAIVQTGRQILENSIRLINNGKWGARVVYGDTDSLFCYLPGRCLKDAFVIGNEIVNAITKSQPNPITLKFEKVYYPCFLFAKKRYAGNMFESPKDNPRFDAKGIETVRRDTCPATVKIMEKCLKIMFETADLSAVKDYIGRQFVKIMSGKMSTKEFIIAKEVKLTKYSSRESTLPPGAVLSLEKMKRDRRREPQYGERIPYLVVNGLQGDRLIDLVVCPEELLSTRKYHLNYAYYINKQIIPALSRMFHLIGVDVIEWFNELPRSLRASGANQKHILVDHYYSKINCKCCGSHLPNQKEDLCVNCINDESATLLHLNSRHRRLQSKSFGIARICSSCASCYDPSFSLGQVIQCRSLDCELAFENCF